MKKNKQKKGNEVKPKTPLVKKYTLEIKHYLGLGFIFLLTLISYHSVFRNGFVNWDDYNYVINNPFIKSIHLQEIFSQFYYGNYHPFTMLIYSIQYKFFALNPAGYHGISVFIHLINVFLVFYAVLMLSNKNEVAFLAALLFAIHPMHVETVAWASELKDLLYTMFFLASYIYYLKYLRENINTYKTIALALFLLSLLSKAMAASLPVLLVLTDYFLAKDSNEKPLKLIWKSIVQKWPYFALSLLFGIVAVLAQKATNSIADISLYSFPQRIVFAAYGFVSYIFKWIAPFQLSAYYPYPINTGSSLPAIYYLYLVLLIGVIAAAFYSLRFTKKVFFGIGFFAITVFLVLQLLPVGGAIMADRYSYIPSIGLGYLIAEGFFIFWQGKFKTPAAMVMVVFLVFLMVRTDARCKVWKDGLSLWNDVIENYQTIPIAYNNRGFLLTDQKRYEEAMNDLNAAIALKADYSVAYYNRGVLYFMQGKNELSLNDFNKSIELDKGYVDAYFSRGVLLRTQKQYDAALQDFNKAISLKSGSEFILFNRGLTYEDMSRPGEALKDYNEAIRINPGFSEAIERRNQLSLK